mmetsp:Transcript_16385/g.23799  ORF Transcript_16385/g.23799 Transcript_16385/m.23799 type:complete len:94 (+) Transcript_16385:195-476(+)
MPNPSLPKAYSTKHAQSIRDEFLPPQATTKVGSNTSNSNNDDEERQEKNSAHVSRIIVPTQYNCVKLVCPQDILLGRGAPIMNRKTFCCCFCR